MSWKWKKPKQSSYTRHCGQCANWTFLRQIGCAVEGICDYGGNEKTIEDAYGVPCGLWRKK